VVEPAAALRIGIVSWNTADLLDRCLGSLPAALEGLPAEVVVVDNASSDASADVAARHAGVDVVRNEVNVGYARAMNQALAGTGAPALLALNPDTEPGAGSLAALHDTLMAHPEAGVVVPRLSNPDGSLQRSVQRFPSLPLALASGFLPPRWQRGRLGRRFWLEGAPTHDRSGPIEWAIGAVHLIRAEAVAGSLPYSERWFMYAEDIEICWRLRRDGWTVWLDAEVEVPHASNASGAQAWGWTRGRRFWAASYDFDALAHGPAHARTWAAVNAAAGATHLVANRAGALAGGPSSERRRHAAAELRANLPVHVRAALRGAPPP
jgi:N-acetylglucosaminyl-diphospho-decaprenol L-rhamnosyltransferase